MWWKVPKLFRCVNLVCAFTCSWSWEIVMKHSRDLWCLTSGKGVNILLRRRLRMTCCMWRERRCWLLVNSLYVFFAVFLISCSLLLKLSLAGHWCGPGKPNRLLCFLALQYCIILCSWHLWLYYHVSIASVCLSILSQRVEHIFCYCQNRYCSLRSCAYLYCICRSVLRKGIYIRLKCCNLRCNLQ